jgi:hypothetical protein
MAQRGKSLTFEAAEVEDLLHMELQPVERGIGSPQRIALQIALV